MTRDRWMKLTLDTWTLGLEASSVIGLRTLKLAAGGAEAQKEAALMVSEKMQSLLTLQAKGAVGGLGLTPEKVARTTLSHYRRKVRANQRRLTKGQ